MDVADAQRRLGRTRPAHHIVAGNFWAAELGASRTIAEVGARLDGDVLGGDPLGAYNASVAVAATAFEAPVA